MKQRNPIGNRFRTSYAPFVPISNSLSSAELSPSLAFCRALLEHHSTIVRAHIVETCNFNGLLPPTVMTPLKVLTRRVACPTLVGPPGMALHRFFDRKGGLSGPVRSSTSNSRSEGRRLFHNRPNSMASILTCAPVLAVVLGTRCIA